VLFEHEDHDGTMLGFTDNYVRVSMPFNPSAVNKVIPVVIGRINSDGHCEGTQISAEFPERSTDPTASMRTRTSVLQTS
ncbi:MAG TPA: hypothetical protein PK149_11625, partial [Flavobacteriales bacterium]|nr:hypothetical protein [Flavobacteriales bacterium]